MENYIIYVIDTETTGLDLKNSDIIELSAIRLFLNSDEKTEQKTWLLKAVNAEAITEEALRINNHKKEDILHLTEFGKANYKNPETVLFEIESWINEDGLSAHDRVFAGQNPLFDFTIMENTWERYGVGDTFPFHKGHNKLLVDTKQIALFIDICIDKKRERYNLGSLVKDFGVKKGTAHRADEDTRMTKDLLLVQINALKNAAKEAFLEKLDK
jgi:DNA polymerase III alpha subunit (gram-positive type)